MATVTLDAQQMQDWDSFHKLSQRAFGFPDYYGNNMDAWIDCLSGVRDNDGMSNFALAGNEQLEIVVQGASSLLHRAPHLLESLQEGVEEVNLRCQEAGQEPPLVLRLA